MAELDLEGVMDAIASGCPDGVTTFAYPVESVAAPAFIVGYPTAVDFDVTFGRGSDRAVFPVWHVVGAVTALSTRAALGAAMTGVGSVKAGIDALAGSTYIQTCRVTNATPERIAVGAVEHMAVRYDVEVFS